MRFKMVAAPDATVFNAPPTDDEYPFWLTQCGKSSGIRPMHHSRLKSDVSCIQYVISGKGMINIDGRVYTAGPGDTFLLLEGLDQNYYSYEADHWECLWINFRGVLSEELMKIYRLTDTVVFHNADSYPILMKICEMAQTTTDAQAYGNESARLFLELVQFLSTRRCSEEERMQIPDYVRYYIDCHVAEDVRLADVAQLVHQSVEHVIRTFKKKYRITPYQYLLESKMRLACFMLAGTDKTVEEIAAELGFYDAHHFSARFQKVQGCRPSEFRRKCMTLPQKVIPFVKKGK